MSVKCLFLSNNLIKNKLLIITSWKRHSWISILNPVYYPFSGAWNSIWDLCWSSGDGIDSSYAKIKLALFGLPSLTPSDRHKIQGPKVPTTSILLLNLYGLDLSHINLHLPGIAVINGISFLFSSLLLGQHQKLLE